MLNKYLNKITHGDSLKILKELPDKSIDMILTDPPYFEKAFKISANQKNISRLNANITKSLKFVDKINSIIKPNDWFEEAIRVSKKINWIIWLDDRHQLLDYLLLIKQYNMSFYTLNWYKSNSTPFNNVYLKDKEMALYIYKDSPVDCLDGHENRKTIFKMTNNSSNGKKEEFVNWHPTPKPTNIIKQMIKKHTNKNDIVLDIFSGSGTTAVACKQLNRQFIAIELDKEFYENSVKRLESEGSQLTFDF